MTRLQDIGMPESREQVSQGEVRLTTFIPVRFVRHKARKVVVHADARGRLQMPAQAGHGAPAADANLLQALARGLYWQQLLDEGRVSNVGEIAVAEGVDKARVQKLLKLARLAPDLAEDIARGQQPVGLSLEFFIRQPLPLDWEGQRGVIAGLIQ